MRFTDPAAPAAGTTPSQFRRRRLRVTLACAALALGSAQGAEGPSARELAELSLDELASLQITSVSKKPERLSDAPASVFVITAEDIRRSGVDSLPEALRLAPNLHVARANVNGYSITARGATNNSANKLLVMIDGRSVYTPLFAGVFWDVQEVMLEDVERIEVISGPGGTLWGVNAVNGVINVTTRNAARTHGTLASARAGTEASHGALRHGGRAGDHGHYRVYARYTDRDNTETAAGVAIDDGSHLALAGFRLDWARAAAQAMVSGNAYRGSIGQPSPGSITISGVNLPLAAIPVEGANLTARWTQQLPGGSEAMLQAYLDRTERTVPPTFAERLDIVDVQGQHSVAWAPSQSAVWGAQYRYSFDRVENSDFFAFLPARLEQKWWSLFAQNESHLGRDLRLVLGARLERNDYTGMEFLPNARLAWKLSRDLSAWTSIARTVRAPSRLDRDAFIPGRPPFLLRGGPEARSEVATVYEAGLRGQATPRFSYSATVYHARYDRMHTQEIDPGRTFIVFSDRMEGETTGFESWMKWQAASAWRLSAGYTALRQRFRVTAGSNDTVSAATAGRDPAHSWVLRSSLNPTASTEVDLSLRGTAALANPAVPRYATADLRLGWRPRPGLELALVGRNLLGGGHGEFSAITVRTEFERSVQASIRWDFEPR